MLEIAGAISILGIVCLISFGLGFVAGLLKAKKWLSRNGCYVCNEGFKYEFGFKEEKDN